MFVNTKRFNVISLPVDGDSKILSSEASSMVLTPTSLLQQSEISSLVMSRCH